MAHKRDERLIIPAHLFPIHAMHIGRIEEIAHLPPAFVIDLLPFRLAVEIELQIRQVEAFAQIRAWPVGRSTIE